MKLHLNLTGTIALGILSTANVAQAADLGGRAPASAPGYEARDSRAPIWQGAYIGAALDITGRATTVEKLGAFNKVDITNNDVAPALYAGYNFQSGPWVFGIEGDWSFQGSKTKKSDPTLGTLQVESGNVGSIRGRAGYAFNEWLLYGTAGVAFLDREISATAGGKQSDWRTGFVIGLGAEYAFNPNWTARAEALAYGFGEEDVALGGVKRNVADGVGTIRLGVARKF
jgi:outer membrane immunogenic protein